MAGVLFRSWVIQYRHGPTGTHTRLVFLTISTTGNEQHPATDLGFLLHKHPDRAFSTNLSYGNP